MKFARLVKYFVSGLALALFASSALLAQGESASTPAGGSDAWGYVFKGFEPLKSFKKEQVPVVGADRKGLLIDTNKGVKRAKYGQAGVSFTPKVALTQHFAQVVDFEMTFENMAQFRRENALQSALDSEASEAQVAIDRVDTTPAGQQVAGQPSNMSREEYRASATDRLESSGQILEALGSQARQVADTIVVSFQLVPSVDVVDAYAAVLVQHDALDKKGQSVGRSNLMSVEKLGNLTAGVPNKVAFRLSTREQLIQKSDFKMYLFSGDGEPIATNASGEVQAVSLAQKEAIEKKMGQ